MFAIRTRPMVPTVAGAPFREKLKAAYMFRPGFIVPLHSITSKTRAYRIIYALTRPIWRPLQAAFPQAIVTTEEVGRAMIRAARTGAPKSVLESADINALSV